MINYLHLQLDLASGHVQCVVKVVLCNEILYQMPGFSPIESTYMQYQCFCVVRPFTKCQAQFTRAALRFVQCHFWYCYKHCFCIIFCSHSCMTHPSLWHSIMCHVHTHSTTIFHHIYPIFYPIALLQTLLRCM